MKGDALIREGYWRPMLFMVPLEDGDRTEALVKMGKKVIAIDLNPLSRTAQKATITIVDNIVRAAPRLVETAEKLKKQGVRKCREILRNFDNKKNLAESINFMNENLSKFAEKSCASRARANDVMFNRIFILGAGAIGSVIGALLSKKNDVTLIGNKAHVDAVNSNGLSVSGDVDETFRVQADTEIREIPWETLIFLTTKAYDSEKAIRGIDRLLREDTVVLVLQNGLGNEEMVKRAVSGKAKVLRGVTSMAAEFFKAGEVRYWKGETTIEHDIVAEKVADILNACGFEDKSFREHQRQKYGARSSLTAW